MKVIGSRPRKRQVGAQSPGDPRGAEGRALRSRPGRRPSPRTLLPPGAASSSASLTLCSREPPPPSPRCSLSVAHSSRPRVWRHPLLEGRGPAAGAHTGPGHLRPPVCLSPDAAAFTNPKPSPSSSLPKRHLRYHLLSQ